MSVHCSRWVYIFGMQNEGGMFEGLFAEKMLGDVICTGLYKIGTTINPLRRWHQVQVHSPWDLRVFAVIPGGYELEAEIHKQLDEHRTRGEWFEMSRIEMFELLQELEGRSAIAQEMFPELPWYTFIRKEQQTEKLTCQGN